MRTEPPTVARLAERDERLHVWCKGCQRARDVTCQSLADAGQGDRLVISLKFRCTFCGSPRTDWIVAAGRVNGR